MDSDDKSDDVRRRMSALRSNLEGDVQNVTESARALAENARTMADWRYVVRRFPFAAAGAAAVVGYLVIPRRNHVIVPDADTLAKMAKANQVWVKTGSPKAQEKERGMFGALLALAASAAGRYAMNLATEQFKASMKTAAKATAEHSQEKHDEEQGVRQTSKYPPR